MPREGSIPADVIAVLRGRPNGATLTEITEAVRKRRGHVLPHSVRSAVFAHMDGKGEDLFARTTEPGKRGVYRLKT